MKHLFLLLAPIFLSATAYATDKDAYVCTKKEGTLISFNVTGDKAVIKARGKSAEYRVTQEFSAKSAKDLKEFSDYIGEAAVSAVGYALKGEIDTGVWVVNGKSTNVYLIEAGMEINLVGSEKYCRRSPMDAPDSSNSSSEASLLLLQILRQGR